MNESSRIRWLATKDLDNDQLDADAERRVMADDEAERDRERQALID